MFTWEKGADNEPRPESVVIVETATVQAVAMVSGPSGSPFASASNGLDSRFCTNTSTVQEQWITLPFPPNRQIRIGAVANSSSTGTAAKVVAGADSISVTCTLNATSASSNAAYSGSVSYSVQVYPVRVSVAGTLQVGTDTQILPGQKATATLSPGAPDVGVKPGSYLYSATGDKFKDYIANSTSGTLITVPASEWTQSSPSWRWRKNAVSEVTGSGELVYSGIEIGTGSAKKSVAVAEVYSSAFELTPVNTGRIYLDGTTVRLTSKVLGTNNQETPGIWIYWQTQTPAAFAIQGAAQNAIVQLVDGKFLAQWSAGNEALYDTQGEALDRQYPYLNGGWFAETSQYKSTSDSPNMWAQTTDPDFGTLNGLGVDHFTARTFLLYLAPGSDSRPVPLKRQNWTWAGAANKKPDGSWGWFDDDNISKVELSGVSEKNPAHPTWTKKS